MNEHSSRDWTSYLGNSRPGKTPRWKTRTRPSFGKLRRFSKHQRDGIRTVSRIRTKRLLSPGCCYLDILGF